MIKQLKSDISKLVVDYTSVCLDSNLDEITEYIVEILKEIGYDKKKYLFSRFIRQLIAESAPEIYGDSYNHFKLNDNSDIVKYLETIPQYEQRSPEWYAARKNSIGASESATIFGLNPYETENKLILKKCGVVNEADMKRMKVVCEHGVKYEPIIQDMYCRDKNTTIKEFGSIPHSDPNLSIVTASPDGITPEGCMLEIKAPAKRIITGIPPAYYWIQCQQQMQVCKLEKVDFLEVKIEEYTNIDDYILDSKNGDDESPYTENGFEKNVIIEYHKLDSDSNLGYIYPDKLLNTSEIKEWKNRVENNLDKTDNKQFRRLSYWKCKQYCLTEIYRDQEWWDKNVDKFDIFWKKVEHYREVGHQSLLPKKRVPYLAKPVDCLIQSDDEDNNSKKTNKSDTLNSSTCIILSDED